MHMYKKKERNTERNAFPEATSLYRGVPGRDETAGLPRGGDGPALEGGRPLLAGLCVAECPGFARSRVWDDCRVTGPSRRTGIGVSGSVRGGEACGGVVIATFALAGAGVAVFVARFTVVAALLRAAVATATTGATTAGPGCPWVTGSTGTGDVSVTGAIAAAAGVEVAGSVAAEAVAATAAGFLFSLFISCNTFFP